MDDPQLYKLIDEAFWFLLEDYGFKVISRRYDGEAFGNAVVTLQSDTHIIRIVRERGQIFMDIGLASNSAALYDLAILVRFIDPESNDAPYHNPHPESRYYSSTPWKLRQVKQVFQKYQNELLSPDFLTKQRSRLDKFVQEKYVNPWLRN